MFPMLDPAQIDVAARFADSVERRFGPGETLYLVGDEAVPVWLVTEGAIEASRNAGLSGRSPIVTHRKGQFTGEISQLSGRPALATAKAGPQGCSAIPFDAFHLRSLMIGSAEIGETIMRAFILRRVGLIETGGSGSILIGDAGDARLVKLRGFLTRSSFPHLVLDVDVDREADDLIMRLGVVASELPLMVCPSGTVLRNPSFAEAAACLGMVPALDEHETYDVAVIGAGPAGLAAAVYAASEGLAVLVLDERAFGGQAGASSRIENYLGFPTGISGQALAGRAYSQALKFGAKVAIPVRAGALRTQETGFELALSESRAIRASTVVIATGARYRRPEVPRLESFEGRGISYWATPIEAAMCEGRDVALVGGGNSAGQAVVFLAGKVRVLHLMVRRNISETMSSYLVDRIDALDNVQVHIGSEIVGVDGVDGELGSATFEDRGDGTSTRYDVAHLFLFIGADPNAEWLSDTVAVNEDGFILTGPAVDADDGAIRLPLETSRRGVFAIGDVRAGSTKRVAAAVGEGAAVVAQIHLSLADRAR